MPGTTTCKQRKQLNNVIDGQQSKHVIFVFMLFRCNSNLSFDHLDLIIIVQVIFKSFSRHSTTDNIVQLLNCHSN